MQRNIWFILGCPGAGKGTQCKHLFDKFKFHHLSAGQLLRNAMQEDSKHSPLIKKTLQKGQIVPVSVTLELLQEKIQETTKEHFLIDGFPRNFDNVQGWEQAMNSTKFPIFSVLFLDAPQHIAEKRLMGRGREDDTIETIQRRFDVFRKETIPVVEYYEKLKVLQRISSVGTRDEVAKRTVAAVTRVLAEHKLNNTSDDKVE